jgi:hypothetical protein
MPLDQGQEVLTPTTGVDLSRCEPAVQFKPVRIPTLGDALPNLSDWRPGDVILFGSNAGADPVGSMIAAAQTAWFKSAPEHARWVHAAIYVGRGTIIQSVASGGVQVDSEGLGVRLSYGAPIRVLRFDDLARLPNINRQFVGYQLAVEACAHVGAAYNWKALVGMVVNRFLQSASPRVNYYQLNNFLQNAGAPALLCSQLVELAMLRTRLGAIDNSAKIPTLPFVLSRSGRFKEIQLTWRAVL